MYEQYWHLKEKPFQNTPDPRFLYLAPQYEDALMKLTYVVAQGLGCGMLTGSFGCGKTLLAQVIMRDLGRDKFCTAYINNPLVLEPAEIIRTIVRSLVPQPLPNKKTEILIDPLLENLQNILINNIRDGKENLIIIDEAHTIEDMRIFEQLRLMLNFQTQSRFLLTLLILGQPELEEKINAIKPLAQRVPIRCTLGTLTEEEVGKYINYRINVAQAEASKETQLSLFDKGAVKVVYNYSGGIPRRINTLCDLVLLSGFAKKNNKIDASFVEGVIKEFNLS